MRPEAATMMKQQMGAIGRVYSTLTELTGTEIPEIERMLERYQPELLASRRGRRLTELIPGTRAR